MKSIDRLARVRALGGRMFRLGARSKAYTAHLPALDSWRVEVLLLAGLLSVTFSLSRGYALFSEHPPDWMHLGAEYWNIARALNQGRGFSDPFGHQTGPTSWMAPLFSLFLAGGMAIFRAKTTVAHVVAATGNIALAVVGVIVFRVARRHCHWLSPFVVLSIYIAWLCVFYSSYFMLSHDIWFAALLSSFLVLLISTYTKTGIVVGWKWGMLGGITVLSNPALALAWIVLVAHHFRRKPNQRRSLLWAVALAGLLASPWLARNAVVFHQFIPTKSNSGYEAYQANVVDEDGVYDELTFWHHPYVSLEARLRYAQVGEKEFIHQHQQAFIKAVRRQPARFLGRIVNRVLATTVCYPPLDATDQVGVGFSLRRIFYSLPVVGALTALWLTKRERAFVSQLCMAYFAFLMPYWLVAFYVRHLFAMTPLLVVAMSLGVDALLGWLKDARSHQREWNGEFN